MLALSGSTKGSSDTSLLYWKMAVAVVMLGDVVGARSCLADSEWLVHCQPCSWTPDPSRVRLTDGHLQSLVFLPQIRVLLSQRGADASHVLQRTLLCLCVVVQGDTHSEIEKLRLSHGLALVCNSWQGEGSQHTFVGKLGLDVFCRPRQSKLAHALGVVTNEGIDVALQWSSRV